MNDTDDEPAAAIPLETMRQLVFGAQADESESQQEAS